MYIYYVLRRHVRRRHERRTLQRPPFRTYTSTTRATNHRSRNRDGRGRQDERRLDDDGFPATTARHGTGRALRMSRADAYGRIPLSALRRAALRCADRLRYLWLDDRVVASSRTELSSLVSRQALLDRVSIVLPPHFAEKLSERQTLFFFPLCRMSAQETVGSNPNCLACALPFKTTPGTNVGEGMSPFDRYRCQDCKNDFCTECDVFVHDVLHCCPGCET